MKTLRLSLRVVPSHLKRFSLHIVRLSAMLFFLLNLIGSTSQAQVYTWDGGGGDNNWSTPGNWSSDIVPGGTGAAALFTDDLVGKTKLTPNLSADVTIGQLQYSATAPSYNITGTGASILYLSPVASFSGVGIIISSGAANQTISAAEVYFLTNQTWDIGGTTILLVSGTIEDAASPDYALTKNGTGTIVFPGDVRYDGPTTVNAGELILSYSNTSMLSAFTVNGGILRATTNVNALGNSVMRNTIALAGGELELANNTGLAFGPSNRKTTVSGNTTISSDRLAAGAGVTHTLGILSIGEQILSVTAGAFVNSGTAGITFGATTLSGNATFDVVNNGSANAQLTLGAVGQSGGTRSLTKTGNGTLRLNGAGNYTGSTTVSQGAITLGIANALGSGGFNFAGGTLNDNNVTDNTIGALMLTDNSTLNLSPDGTSATLTFSGVSENANGILTITGWSGSAGGLGTDDKIIFSGGTTPNADFLQHIHFDLGGGNIYYAALSAGGELFPNAAFPVEISAFTAKLIEKDKVDLNWSTATEVNNYGFDVERKGGNSGWDKIGFVPGAGNSNSPKNYSFTDQLTGGTSFSYRLKQIDVSGAYKYYEAITVSLLESDKAELMQNSPNPFNPSTSIKYYIPLTVDVSIIIYDILGREVNRIIDNQASAGYHIVYWNGRDIHGNNVASGAYLYRITAGRFTETKKMLFMK